MADNVAITEGVGKAIATDDVSGVHYQRVKPAFGADGSATDVSTGSPLPVTIATGSLMERIEELTLVLHRLLSGAAGQAPDPAGRTRVSLDAGGLSTIATVSTVTSIANPITIGNNLQNFGYLRDRIVVT